MIRHGVDENWRGTEVYGKRLMGGRDRLWQRG